MKKTAISVIAAVILISCILAACNGAEGGKITDNRQNLSEAMTGVQDMMTDISEMFTNAPDTVTVTEVPSSAADTVTNAG